MLLAGEPGVGKTVFMAQLARDHPDWPRYFIGRESQTPFQSGEARAFILTLGHQLAAISPELFLSNALNVKVCQQVDDLQASGKVTGIDIREFVLSLFQHTASILRPSWYETLIPRPANTLPMWRGSRPYVMGRFFAFDRQALP